VEPSTNVRLTDPPPPEPKDLIDVKVVLGWAKLLLWFVRKRKWVPIMMVIVMGGAAVGALQVLPKTYECQSRLLAKRNEYLSPDRRGQLTESASEVLHRKETLAHIVQQTDLVKEWKARREPVFRLKDQIMAYIFAPISDTDLAEVLLVMLDNNLNVEADQETVTITVEWRDPELAFRLVTAAQQAFLEERHVQEIGLLAESTAILEGHAAKLEQEIKASIENLRGVIHAKGGGAKPAPDPATTDADKAAKPKPKSVFRPFEAKGAPQPSEADQARIAELGALIEAKKSSLEGLAGSKQQKVDDLSNRLSQLRSIYTDAHPAIEDLKRQLEVADQDSPMLAKLRAEMQALESEKASLQNQFIAAGTPTRPSGAFVELGHQALDDLKATPGIDLDDPEIRFAGTQVGFTISKYHNILKEIDGARVDQEKAQAAFKHRYRVVHPPEVPKRPIKPNPIKIVAGALLGGLFLGLMIAIAIELRRDLIYEPWQVEGMLNLPVVANVNLIGPGTSRPS
jgi:uncharacterized protein involved in exopolysaccharide biosynthesis